MPRKLFNRPDLVHISPRQVFRAKPEDVYQDLDPFMAATLMAYLKPLPKKDEIITMTVDELALLLYSVWWDGYREGGV